MADDYVKTADKMMFDARTLREAGAHRNACYLAGYVVECTLKVLLDKAGLAPEKTHDLESLHEAVARGNAKLARYGDPARLAPMMLNQVAPARLRAQTTRARAGHPATVAAAGPVAAGLRRDAGATAGLHPSG